MALAQELGADVPPPADEPSTDLTPAGSTATAQVAQQPGVQSPSWLVEGHPPKGTAAGAKARSGSAHRASAKPSAPLPENHWEILAGNLGLALPERPVEASAVKKGPRPSAATRPPAREPQTTEIRSTTATVPPDQQQAVEAGVTLTVVDQVSPTQTLAADGDRGEMPHESSPETEPDSRKPRRRRGRRGRRRRPGQGREGVAAEHNAPGAVDTEPDNSELASDDVDPAESVEPQSQRAAAVRPGRRGSGRLTSRKEPDEEYEEEEEEGEEEDTEQDEEDEEQDEQRDEEEDEEQLDTHALPRSQRDLSSSEAGPGEMDERARSRRVSRAFPTWAEAVGLIVSANIESRQKSPPSGPRGRRRRPPPRRH